VPRILCALFILTGSAATPAGEPPVKPADLAGLWEYSYSSAPLFPAEDRTFLLMNPDGTGARWDLQNGQVEGCLSLTYRLNGTKCVVKRRSENDRNLDILFLSRDKVIFYDRARDLSLVYVRR
jgi:hypothetical protein